MIKILLITIQIFFLCQICPVVAANEESMDEETEDGEYKPVTSVEAYALNKQTANSLGLAAEYATSHGQYDQAIKLCKRALNEDYNDLDVHMAYANALQEKLQAQKAPDPDLLNQCIREWLIVYRTEVGDEKGLSFHGISPLGHLYEDEERSIPARSHLIKLTGRAPRPWETDVKFLKWVNRPTTAVSARLLSKPADNNKNVGDKITVEKTNDEK